MTDPTTPEPKPGENPAPYPTPSGSAYPSPPAANYPSQPSAGYPAPDANPYASQAPYSLAPTPQPKIVLSLIGMISGILGILAGVFGWGLLLSIAGVVLGHLGQRREPWAKGFWLTALITGYVGVLLNVLIIVFFLVAFFALMQVGSSYSY